MDGKFLLKALNVAFVLLFLGYWTSRACAAMSFGVAPWWAWALIYAAVLIVTMLWTGADRLAKLEGKKDQR